MSSSVTPPNITPSPRALHKAIVHPLRKDGANAVEGRLRFSHLTVKGSLPLAAFDETAFLLAGAGAGVAIAASPVIIVILDAGLHISIEERGA